MVCLLFLLVASGLNSKQLYLLLIKMNLDGIYNLFVFGGGPSQRGKYFSPEKVHFKIVNIKDVLFFICSGNASK